MSTIDHLFCFSFFTAGMALLIWSQSISSPGGSFMVTVFGMVLALTASYNLRLPPE